MKIENDQRTRETYLDTRHNPNPNPNQVDIPHDLPTLRRNITDWLSQSVKQP
jgi:hypothetical protein